MSGDPFRFPPPPMDTPSSSSQRIPQPSAQAHSSRASQAHPAVSPPQVGAISHTPTAPRAGGGHGRGHGTQHSTQHATQQQSQQTPTNSNNSNMVDTSAPPMSSSTGRAPMTGLTTPTQTQQQQLQPSPASSSNNRHHQFTSPSTSELESSDRWLTDRIVTVIVGREEKKWAVHAKLLCSKSKFFDRFFNGDEDHQPRDDMHLPREDPKLFALLIRWLYGTAFANSGGTRIFRFNPPDGKDITVRDYIGLYILGGKIEIMGVKNAAIDALYAYFGPDAEKASPHEEARHPDLRDIRYAFENTPPDSHMRRLLIAHALFHLFGKKRRSAPLPPAWEEVISQNGEIAWAMIKMLSDWKWVMGNNVPDMKIKARQEFHERPFVPPPAVPAAGEGLGLGPQGQAIKTEPGVDRGDGGEYN